jgi:glucose-1-phosphate cytidylyltransferase
VTFDLSNNSIDVHQNTAEPWRVTLVDTGEESGTGGRLRRVRDYLDAEDFCFTYGDGVSDVNIEELVAFHRAHGRQATMTAIQPPSKYGVLGFDGNTVKTFREKPAGQGGWINGGFFVLSPQVLDTIDSDETHFEHAPMKKLVASGELCAFRHDGYWQCLDTLRDKMVLESAWSSATAPWKVWS